MAGTYRPLATLACLLSLICPLARAQTPKDLTLGPPINTNGGFEEGKQGYYYTKPPRASIDTDVVYRGQASLRIEGEGTGEKTDNNIATQGARIPPPGPNTYYLIRAAVKAKNVDPAYPPAIQINYGSPAKNLNVLAREEGYIREDTDWRVIEMRTNALSPDTDRLGFWIVLSPASRATVWVDDIEVRQILNPPAEGFREQPVKPTPAPTATAAAVAAPTPAPETAALPSAPAGWAIDVNHAQLAMYERGDEAFATLTWTGTGPAPAPPPLALFDHRERKVRDLATQPQGGAWRIALPTDRMGYFEIRPLVANPETVIPALGSRPAGRLTFAVVDTIERDPSVGFTDSFFSTQGTTLLPGRKDPRFGWDMLPYLGVQSQGVGYQWRTWEPDGPNTFDANIGRDRAPEWMREMRIVPYFHLNAVPMWAADASRLPEKERGDKATQRIPPRDWAQWEAYLEKVVPYIARKYDFLDERVYEVMWEPVIPWGWYGTVDEIVKTFEIAHRVIRKHDPKGGRVAGPTLSSLGDTTYFETLLKAGIGRYLDVVSFHPYKGYPPEKNNIAGGLAGIRDVTRRYVGRELPFIGTEFGFPQGATGSLLNQSLGMTTSLLIFKGEGAQKHTLFYMTDYAGEPGYGMMYNLVPNLPFGAGKVSPKPGIPMIRAAADQIRNTATVGRLDYLGADIWGYVYRNKATGELIAALWDASDRDRMIVFDTGVDAVGLVDSFGNRRRQPTEAGRLRLSLERSPVYVRGVSAELYGAGKVTPLFAEKTWKVFRGRRNPITLEFGRTIGQGEATLTFDAPAEVSAERLSAKVRPAAGTRITLEAPIEANAPLGPVAASVRIVDGDATLYRGVQRLEVMPELEIGPLAAVRDGRGWKVTSTVRNLQPAQWTGTAMLDFAGSAPASQPIALAVGEKRAVSFAVTPQTAARTSEAALSLKTATGVELKRAEPLAFLQIQRKPAGADFWTKLSTIDLKGTDATIWRAHSSTAFGGDADLSARAAYAYDDRNVYVSFVVTDDVHRQTQQPGTTWAEDSLQLAFDTAPGRAQNTNLLAEGHENTRSEWTLSFTPRGPEVYLAIAPGGSKAAQNAVVREAGVKLEGGRDGVQTTYRLTLPWTLLDPEGKRDKARLAVSAAINDSDKAAQFNDRRVLTLFSGIVSSKDTALYGVAQLQR